MKRISKTPKPSKAKCRQCGVPAPWLDILGLPFEKKGLICQLCEGLNKRVKQYVVPKILCTMNRV
jgi:hypothetical protein